MKEITIPTNKSIININTDNTEVAIKGEDINYGGSNVGLLNELQDKIDKGTLSYEKMFNVSVLDENNVIRVVFIEK